MYVCVCVVVLCELACGKMEFTAKIKYENINYTDVKIARICMTYFIKNYILFSISSRQVNDFVLRQVSEKVFYDNYTLHHT